MEDYKDLYTSGNTRNPGVWTAPIDLTCVSKSWEPVTAISPTQALGAGHSSPNVGATVSWVAADGVLVSRTVTAKTALGVRDLVMVEWAEPLPSTISPAIVAPRTDFTAGDTERILVWVNQYQRAGVLQVQWFEPVSQNGIGKVLFDGNTPPQHRPDLLQSVVADDSGSPVFLVADIGGVSRPWLVGTVQTSAYANAVYRELLP